MTRRSGVLLHPTSLPGPHGIGDLGECAHRFLDRLAGAGQRVWQMLPLNDPGHGGSPYSALSAFAANPALIDMRDLVTRGLLDAEHLRGLEALNASTPQTQAALHEAGEQKRYLLGLAAGHVAYHGLSDEDAASFDAFCAHNAYWLDDYSLFIAIKDAHGGGSWQEWPAPLVARDPAALEVARAEYADVIAREKLAQWLFEQQWQRLRQRARDLSIELVGDIPIFVAMDSADVWANRGLFQVAQDGTANVVAGVPPDYFSKTGQKWGNPLYDWPAVHRTGYAWWIDRVRRAVEQVDLVRIDHFRGFEAYWEVPASEPTAVKGRWRKGPGDAFFNAIRNALGEVPFIAEDLGLITPEVLALRDRHALPGMKVMHFAFGGEPDHPFLPHTYPTRCVAYLGTHDNDTTLGWYTQLDPMEKHKVRVYLSASDEQVVAAMLERMYGSRASLVITTGQDLWRLGTTARMNTPSTTEGNWLWRMTRAQLDDDRAWRGLGDLTRRHGR